MTDFAEQYREAFASLARPLRPRDRTPANEIREAEKRLGVRAPAALCDYYRVAGRASDFNCVHDRLLPPADWFIDGGKLVFREENQAVVLYGTEANTDLVDDPLGFLGANNDSIRWQKVNERCFILLLVMLHWCERNCCARGPEKR